MPYHSAGLLASATPTPSRLRSGYLSGTLGPLQQHACPGFSPGSRSPSSIYLVCLADRHLRSVNRILPATEVRLKSFVRSAPNSRSALVSHLPSDDSVPGLYSRQSQRSDSGRIERPWRLL